MPSQLSHESITRLLELLSSDDGFRQQFQANPRKAMQAAGFGDADGVPETAIGTLAGKDELAATRDEMQQKLQMSLEPYVPVLLDTSRSA